MYCIMYCTVTVILLVLTHDGFESFSSFSSFSAGFDDCSDLLLYVIISLAQCHHPREQEETSTRAAGLRAEGLANVCNPRPPTLKFILSR